MTNTLLTFHDYPCVETSAEVWAVIQDRHKDQLKVFSSFSDPSGTQFGGPGIQGRMETCYGINGADYPLIGANSTWDIGEGGERRNLHTVYFLFAINKDNYND